MKRKLSKKRREFLWKLYLTYGDSPIEQNSIINYDYSKLTFFIGLVNIDMIKSSVSYDVDKNGMFKARFYYRIDDDILKKVIKYYEQI